MNQLSHIVPSIQEEVKEIATKLAENPPLSLAEAEALLRETTRDWERRLLQGCYVPHATSPTWEVTCPVCQQPMQRHRLRDKWIMTGCGEVLVSRWYYQCPSGHHHFPWDATQELRGRYSKTVAETMCRLGARLDFREAADELKRQGINVSHTTLEQTTEEWGTAVDVSDWVSSQPLEERQRWYVICDGCQTHSPDGWHEVKVGTVYRDYPQYGEKSEAHAIEESVRYVATRAPAEEFGPKWFSLATQSGVYREGEEDAEIVAIGDGAAWIWNAVDEYFPTAVEIVDYPHAVQHLWTCAKTAFGEHNETPVSQWVKTTEPPLFLGDIQQVTQRIRRLGGAYPTHQEELNAQAAYFEKHAYRMQYQMFLKKGYQIGSGIVESACKHVVAERCKQAGMKWKHKGIDAILNWRCLLKNGSWDHYWQASQKAA